MRKVSDCDVVSLVASAREFRSCIAFQIFAGEYSGIVEINFDSSQKYCNEEVRHRWRCHIKWEIVSCEHCE